MGLNQKYQYKYKLIIMKTKYIQHLPGTLYKNKNKFLKGKIKQKYFFIWYLPAFNDLYNQIIINDYGYVKC